MSSSIGDLFPFGDADDALMRASAAYPGLPVGDMRAALDLGSSVVGFLESLARPLAEAGLSPARWRLLVALMFQADPGGASIGELAGHLRVREPTITATVDRAERDGLVERRRDLNDQRVVRVVPTAAGRQKLTEVAPGVTGRMLAISRSLGGEAAIRRLAERLRQAAAAAAGAPDIALTATSDLGGSL